MIFFMMIPLFIIALVLMGTFYVVHQQSNAVIERFGKFVCIATPGLNIKIPIIDRIAGRVNLRLQQLDVPVETKTKDDVFVDVNVSVQYQVLPEKVYESFYRLNSAEEQIRAFVFDVVRAQVPKIKVDDVFEKKDDIATVVKQELQETMSEFGYAIVKALVTDIDPDAKVKISMNEINAAQRLRLAATEKGEADRILKVKHAEAEAESKALQGQGIADQRRAIVEGLKESVDDFQKSIPGATAADVMNLVLITQYFDTLKDIGAANKSSTILIPHSPGILGDLTTQMRDAVITGGQINQVSDHRGDLSNEAVS